MNTSKRFRTVFALVGAPSCAKGTCVKLVFEDFCKNAGVTLAVVPVSQKLAHYVGELEDRRLAEKILEDMNSGCLVPDDVTNTVFAAAVDDIVVKHANTEDPLMIVLDGAPRTIGQIQNSIFSVTNKLNVPVSEFNVVHISTPPHICAYRMGIRGRSDDLREKVVSVRFQEYFDKTLPTIKMLKSFTDSSEADFHEVDGQFMMDEAYSYQRKIFSPLWPEFFPKSCW